jgi:hypothetical protein
VLKNSPAGYFSEEASLYCISLTRRSLSDSLKLIIDKFLEALVLKTKLINFEREGEKTLAFSP